MRCTQCQAENREGRRFCSKCGAALARACVSCGFTNEPSDEFCGGCGALLRSSQAVAQPKFGSPESYTPKHLAEKILTSKSALEGERKQVTVLFADLKGSMELLADRDPEEAGRLLDPVLEQMMEAAHRYEGTVNQVMGDGIMALFGAPLACEDHAVRACYAALRMQETVKRYADSVRRKQGIPLQIRVGLNSGEVVVRSIGSDLHMDYTAIGQTTHVAARMEQMALPGSILLSAETLALAEGFVEVRSLGPLPVKGLAAPLDVYELTGAATIRSRFQAAAAHGLTRFVGRESELEQLRLALDRVRAGHGQVVAVVGEPGVGKSRLYWEFTHSHRAEGWLILESRSVSYGKATNYLPIIELLRAYFSIESADTPRKIREKATGKLLSLDRQLEPCVAPILWLLDIPTEDETWDRLDPAQRRQRTLDAVKRLLLRESQVQPLMVLFEDLHWIDAETQAFLDSLMESLPTARVLLLVNYRPEYRHAWGSKTYYRQLQIDPLAPESAEVLLDALLGGDVGLHPLKRLVIERTAGNPFFIEESVRSLIETGVLAGERGAYRATRVVQGLQVPATAQAMLAARIDRLGPEDKRLLQAAAVIGTDVPFELLQAVADEPEERLRRGLAQLQATEFLYETRLFPDLEYTFRHALTHEVAYGSLLADRRRALHARIMGAIESLHPERQAEHVERLAHHAVRGEVWDKALTYQRQAGLRAVGRSVHREAAAAFEQALLALQHLPETRELLEQAVDIRLDMPRTLLPLGQIQQLQGRLGEAETIAKGLDDRRRLGRVAAFQAGSLWWVGEYERGVEAGRRALAIAEALGDVAIRVVGGYYLAMSTFIPGHSRRAAEVLKPIVALLTGELLRERFGGAGYPSAMTRAWLAFCLGELGDFDEAVAFGQEAVRISELLDHPFSLTHACLELGGVYVRKGEPDKAIPVLGRGLDLCRTWDIPVFFPGIVSRLGLAYVQAGRTAEALPLLEQAGEQATASKFLTYPVPAYWFAVISEARLLVGRPDDGLAGRALELARNRREPGNEAWILQLLGEIAARRDPSDVEQAQVSYRRALALGQELEMRPLIAHCHLGLGKLYRRTGKREQAQEHLTTATAMYRAMDMRFWLEQAEVEMRKSA